MNSGLRFATAGRLSQGGLRLRSVKVALGRAEVFMEHRVPWQASLTKSSLRSPHAEAKRRPPFHSLFLAEGLPDDVLPAKPPAEAKAATSRSRGQNNG